MPENARDTRSFEAPPGAEAARSDPLARIAYDHRSQRALADLLERIADSLPDYLDPAGVRRAAETLTAAAARHAALVDGALAPILAARLEPGSPAAAALAVARAEHAEAAGRAVELAEALGTVAETGRPANAEALGFMLRAVFQGLRRHLDWEAAAVLPEAERRLTAADLSTLATRIDGLRGRDAAAPSSRPAARLRTAVG